MNAWIESTQYQQVLRACRSNDRTTINRIIEERLSAVEGRERVFWLQIRAGQRVKDATLPQVVEMAWADLEEALRIAPGDWEGHAATLVSAFQLCVTTERVGRLPGLLGALRREYRLVSPLPAFWHHMGSLHMKRQKWRLAARDFDRAIAAFHALSPSEREMTSCRLVHFHAWRAMTRVACGRTEAAAADLEMALALAANHSPHNISHLALGTARAELALQRGLMQEARSALQQGVMQDQDLKRPKPAPAQMAETELLAARIARAEGNPVGFEHFCERALAVCAQYRLPLTEARVHAIIAGAEV